MAEGERPTMRRADTIIALIAPVVLVAVAVSQLFLATTRDLTPWKGGGFGMFASTDGLNYRPVQAQLLTDTDPIPIAVHDFGGERRAVWRFVHARALPDQRRLSRFVERMEQAQWVVEGGVARFDAWLPEGIRGPLVTTRPDGQGDAIPVHGVQVDVWGVFYTRGSAEVEPRHVGSFAATRQVAR